MPVPQSLPVPLRLEPLLSRIVAALPEDERVLAGWLGGSLARGVADDWSDIDLHLAVAEPAGFDAVTWVETITPLVLADRIPGLPGAFVFLTPDCVQLDVVVHGAGDAEQCRPPSRVLFDREGFARDQSGVLSAPGAPYFPADQARIFLYFLGKSVTAFRRGEHVALAQATASMRDQYLIPLMLAENGVRKDDGARRLNRYLTDDQLRALSALPPIGFDAAVLLDAQRALAAEYVERGRRLAGRCRAQWPGDLEEAVRALLQEEFGLHF